ncbi:hypothetical protein AV274_6199 [Blastocystis sp. ATCC 50177/Nand II]|uniref:Uncharacterized protein n=1 Tax=Blastocystis sp. subtype 1 (strain ATCC 50177 / NandII) TaxID=478820 RepID=A0A196S836_BLAHN|nr:hypothetical protein AV274_6199 [Blastocystis sp. ATCC 50177/Nand II]
MENAESIEQMLKPTRKRRGILLILFFVLASIQVASSLQIQYAADAYNTHIEGKATWIMSRCFIVSSSIELSLFVFVFRCIVLLMGVIGVFHTKITPWTIASTSSFFAYILGSFLRIVIIIKSVTWPQRILNFLLFMYDVTTNIVCLGLTAVFAYQSIYIHSSDKVSLNMQDPQQQFTMLLVKALISILPAAGFFRAPILKAAKLD